jgi:hypothetical protein
MSQKDSSREVCKLQIALFVLGRNLFPGNDGRLQAQGRCWGGGWCRCNNIGLLIVAEKEILLLIFL